MITTALGDLDTVKEEIEFLRLMQGKASLEAFAIIALNKFDNRIIIGYSNYKFSIRDKFEFIPFSSIKDFLECHLVILILN